MWPLMDPGPPGKGIEHLGLKEQASIRIGERISKSISIA